MILLWTDVHTVPIADMHLHHKHKLAIANYFALNKQIHDYNTRVSNDLHILNKQ